MFKHFRKSDDGIYGLPKVFTKLVLNFHGSNPVVNYT